MHPVPPPVPLLMSVSVHCKMVVVNFRIIDVPVHVHFVEHLRIGLVYTKAPDLCPQRRQSVYPVAEQRGGGAVSPLVDPGSSRVATRTEVTTNLAEKTSNTWEAGARRAAFVPTRASTCARVGSAASSPST